ncbi:MAG TPA: hypothetical protein VMP42_08370 [Actinomycetota bacterium]|nr:hypothetical protein [Actinomycetota bacterium]
MTPSNVDLAELELELRLEEDQTERYLAAIRNPEVHGRSASSNLMSADEIVEWAKRSELAAGFEPAT